MKQSAPLSTALLRAQLGIEPICYCLTSIRLTSTPLNLSDVFYQLLMQSATYQQPSLISGSALNFLSKGWPSICHVFLEEVLVSLKFQRMAPSFNISFLVALFALISFAWSFGHRFSRMVRSLENDFLLEKNPLHFTWTAEMSNFLKTNRNRWRIVLSRLFLNRIPATRLEV